MSFVPARFGGAWHAHLARFQERERGRARRLPGWRTRRHRRSLALVVLAGTLLTTVATVTMSEPRHWTFLALWFAGFAVWTAVWTAGWTLLRVLTGKTAGALSGILDEREREPGHRATCIGFQVLVYPMLAAMFYTVAIAEQHDAGFLAVFMMSVLLILGSSMPTIIVGWQLPDDDPDDLADFDTAREGKPDA